MRIINSPVRQRTLNYWYCPEFGQSMAAVKKSLHKQERAQLRQLASQELLADHLVVREEKEEQDRLDREAVYVNAMRKAMAKKHHGHRPAKALPEVRSGVRFEVRIRTNDRKEAVLASCAIDD